jgi:hypothetical protein
VKQLRSELGGNFESLVVASLTPLPTLYARDLNDAISGVGTKEDTIIEVLCALENSEIRAIKNEYEKCKENIKNYYLFNKLSIQYKNIYIFIDFILCILVIYNTSHYFFIKSFF